MTKVIKKGFYCPSDSVYFNTWTKIFILSAKRHAPWAHVHVHIFDPIESDFEWCEKYNVSISTEVTPLQYAKDDITKKGYWVNARFIKLPELYDDNISVIAIDSDSLFVKDLSETEFDVDLQSSWVTVRGDKQASLGSALGFSKDSVRHEYRNRLLTHSNELRWFLDQEILDEMLKENLIGKMSTKYSDFKYNSESIIWTGKGYRKFKKHFVNLADEYRKGLK